MRSHALVYLWKGIRFSWISCSCFHEFCLYNTSPKWSYSPYILQVHVGANLSNIQCVINHREVHIIRKRNSLLDGEFCSPVLIAVAHPAARRSAESPTTLSALKSSITPALFVCWSYDIPPLYYWWKLEANRFSGSLYRKLRKVPI